jgi:hypothetical protein
MSVLAAGLSKGRAMEKILCFGSLGIAILMMLVFLMDLVAGVPFAPPAPATNPFVLLDLLGLLSSAIVAYLAWNASKDLK